MPGPVYNLEGVFSAQIHQAEKEGQKVYEPVVAVVTDNKDPEKLGRVKVKVPILSESDSSHWAPIIMLGAGKNRGWFFIPEVNDEVLVMYEHGDMQRPVVVGALWGGVDKPPEKNSGSNPKRVIKSRQGSKITFDDEKKLIVIEDGKGKGKITIDADKNKIIIEALEGDVCFQSPKGDMTIVAKDMKLEAKQSVELHAGGNMRLGAQTVTLKGQQTSASGQTKNANGGTAQMPPDATATPAEVADPYGS